MASDELTFGLIPSKDFRAMVAVTTGCAQEARRRHQLAPTSAALLAQALCGGALLAGLQKERTHVNLQLECDGPLRGLFVDAESAGALRGYVKNPHLSVRSEDPRYRWRPALGNSGFLSVLRERSAGDFYRSSIALAHFDLAKDLEAFFASSEQLPTYVELALVASGEDELGAVAGLLVQPLPGADRAEFAALSERLGRVGALAAALRTAPGSTASALLSAVLPEPDLEVLSHYPLSFSCNCSKERVLRALATLGREELSDMLAQDGQAELSCQFCGSSYLATAEDLKALLA